MSLWPRARPRSPLLFGLRLVLQLLAFGLWAIAMGLLATLPRPLVMAIRLALMRLPAMLPLELTLLDIVCHLVSPPPRMMHFGVSVLLLAARLLCQLIVLMLPWHSDLRLIVSLSPLRRMSMMPLRFH